MKIRAIEAIQRAENGGSPIGNLLASKNMIGHGEPLLIIATRDFVALLKTVDNVCRYAAATVSPGNRVEQSLKNDWTLVHRGRADSSHRQLGALAADAASLVRELDTFVEPVEPEEISRAREQDIDPDNRKIPPDDGGLYCCRCQKPFLRAAKGKPASSTRRHRQVYLRKEGYLAVHPDDVERYARPDDLGWQPLGNECAHVVGMKWTRPWIDSP